MLVINKVLPKLDFVSLRKQVEATCAAPVAAILPTLEEMMGLGSAGLFNAAFPNHPYRQGVRKIAAQIVNSSEAR